MRMSYLPVLGCSIVWMVRFVQVLSALRRSTILVEQGKGMVAQARRLLTLHYSGGRSYIDEYERQRVACWAHLDQTERANQELDERWTKLGFWTLVLSAAMMVNLMAMIFPEGAP